MDRGNATATEHHGDGRPIIRRITHQPRNWASELRRLHGRGHARAQRPVRRVFWRFAVLALVIVGLTAAVVMMIVVFA